MGDMSPQINQVGLMAELLVYVWWTVSVRFSR